MNIYRVNDIAELIKDNAYVGRGIVIGKTADSKKACAAYFIMGRSQNSRNRIFTVKNNEVFTEPYDASKVEDPSLIIYAAVRSYKNNLIVTNGDQTDTIYDFLKDGKSFEEALRTREYEPDEPNFTPRISGIVDLSNGFSYKLSILKKTNDSCQRNFFEYENGTNGKGHLIHTYVTDGNPIPSYEGEPKSVEISEDIEEFTNGLWDSLDKDNRVSLFVRYINIETKKTETKIINGGLE